MVDNERPSSEDWDQIRTAIKAKWSEITDADLQGLDGDSRKLVALVTQRTGLSLHDAEVAVDELAATSEGLLTRIAGKAQELAADFARPVQAAGESVRNAVADSPSISLATAFGAGLVVGLGLVALLYEPEPKSSWSWK